ncbi:MAG TPA: DNA polymerase III subunit beta [Candidatus Competibacteraceae bacterium]|nr:DNA polymerase III subunit beta [Candidatus Competibacteraceae bacterium]
MKIESQRESLLKPLQNVIGVVERRQTLPVLSNVLLVAHDTGLVMTATDLEVELSARVAVPIAEGGEITLPGRKLLDILRALPEGAAVSLSVEDGKARLSSTRCRFTLATLPAADFPTLEDLPFELELRLPRAQFKRLIERTHFAMAQQDVRYYLNGLLLDIGEGRIRAVATDGHRLAYCEQALEEGGEIVPRQVIVPRKGVQELLRLLNDGDGTVALKVGTNHIQVQLDDIGFTSKLIDGRFPDYQRVIPRQGERVILADRLVLRNALARAAILSSDKYRGIRLQLEDWMLRAQAHNPEQEEAEEEVEVNYSGGPLEIGFNVNYLLDALGALSGDLARLSFTDAVNPCLIQEAESEDCKYVVMPMRL